MTDGPAYRAQLALRRLVPEKVKRYSLTARLFHLVQSAAMLALLVTAFLPKMGVQFAWVEWHWMAGLVLAASILYHIIHATFFMDFWSIWVGPKDIVASPSIPNLAFSWVSRWLSSAFLSNALLGMHPTLRHTPPQYLSSTTAVFNPS